MPEPDPQLSSIVPEDCQGRSVAIIGGGPAGLMAAEVLVGAGASVDVYESMPTLGRKFLRAGLGGLNITHSEPYPTFCSRYGDRQSQLQAVLDRFPPEALREWVHGLGIDTFVGTSGRVFPTEMKAAPLLRAWVHRLRKSGVRFHVSHKWLGFEDDGSLRMESPDGELTVHADAFVLAMGGASWPQLGSTGSWSQRLQDRGVEMAPWQSANCGFDVPWTEPLREKFAGAPLKAVSLTFMDLDGNSETRKGELLISEYGVEGSLIYAFSRRMRDYINVHGNATFELDLLPGRSAERVLKDLSRPRGSRSMSRHLQGCFGNDALKRALLYEVLTREQMEDPAVLARFVKALPITVKSPRPIAEAISSAGGVCFSSLDDNYMLQAVPGVFVAGEMIDWEAPTGGYLLTACFATGRQAALGVTRWLSGSET
ncbi:MAG: TIGR03862 family flavoprotein [Cyanobacteria bacterium HKST-UBA02]|nr:TIGR03862 family flavoprotein [Cyanobacteria bacterium HKST-UBA02]